MSGLANAGAPTTSGGGDDRRPRKKRTLTAEAKEAEKIRQKEKKKRKRARDAQAREQAAAQGQQSASRPATLGALIDEVLHAGPDDHRHHPVYWLGISDAFRLEPSQTVLPHHGGAPSGRGGSANPQAPRGRGGPPRGRGGPPRGRGGPANPQAPRGPTPQAGQNRPPPPPPPTESSQPTTQANAPQGDSQGVQETNAVPEVTMGEEDGPIDWADDSIRAAQENT
ncbi:hypothetical protein N7528_002895 [Penicillium herquei]|nr:hypothetical protein N7528_002895 [Penicillium herquei]